MAEFNLARIRYTWKNVWLPGATYIKDDIVRHGGNNYVCMVGHVSDQVSFSTDLNRTPSYWLLMSDGYAWRGNWTVDTRYKINDLFKYDATIYRVLEEHVSNEDASIGITDTAQSKIIAFAANGNWRINWGPLTRYRVGDFALYGGRLYKCIEEHSSSSTVSGLETDASKWQLQLRTDDYKKEWSLNTRYKADDVVRYGALVYRCNTGHTSATTIANGLEDDLSKWDVLLNGIRYVGGWQDSSDSTGTRYRVGDIVKYGPTLWRCKEAHTSASSFDETKFDIWLPGLGYENIWDQAVTYQPGDIVTYGGYTYTSMTNNVGSPPSVTGVFYEGESLQGLYDWELLITGYKMQGEWSATTDYKTGDVVRNKGFVYIAVKDSLNQEPDALDPESRGYYDPGSTRSTEGSISMFWQLLITGTYYRGEWQSANNYVLGDIVVQAGTTWKCVQAHQGDDSTLVEPAQDNGSYWTKLIQGSTGNVMQQIGDMRGHDGTNHIRLPIGQPGESKKVVNGQATWEAYGQVPKLYYVATTGTDAAGFGLSQNSPFRSIKYATQYILADEANRAPATIMVATGLYKEILPISLPAGVAVVGDELRSVTIAPAAGSEDRDMFYVRNGCGIRNCTLQGLVGSLGEPDLYGARQPTGGAFVSLDPGSGPDDTSVWVTSKSTYVQNVTTLGTGCVGVKADGTLHNGGNKSIVANDFTQVISDGIGAWCNQDGKMELVSVFTYYCHIGYYCTAGGKIRATVGNNSYGTYGSFAEGELASETPLTATVNNRYYDAIAPVVYNNANKIFALGYTHAGEENTDVTYTITGSGSGVNVDNEFAELRNGSIKEIRMLDPGDSTLPGGRGHITGIRNSAQGGTPTSITIAQSDANGPDYYVGRGIVTVENISGADIARVNDPANFPQTYTNIPGTSNNSFASVGTFNVTIDASGLATVVAPVNAGHSHRVGDQITIADTNLGNFGGADLTFTVASVSPGMRIFIEEGEGVGQFGIIDEYFTTTKQINVLRETDGKPGWDHVVPGWPLSTQLDGSTTYRIEPRIEVEEPTYADNDYDTGTSQSYQNCAATSGLTMALFPSAGASKAIYSDSSGGSWQEAVTDAGWVRPNTVIQCKGKLRYFIALGNGNRANLSTACTAWGSDPYPINQHNWIDICEGPYSATSHTVIAIADDSNEIAISNTDGTTWTYVSTGMGTGLKHIRYGNGKWLAVKADGTTYESTDNGQNWSTTTRVCPTTYNVTDFAYGNGKFVAACQPNGTATFPFDPATTMIGSATSSTSATFGLASTFFRSFTDYSEGLNNATWEEPLVNGTVGTTAWGLDYSDGLFMAIDSTGKVLYTGGADIWQEKQQVTIPNGGANFLTKVQATTTTHGPRFFVFNDAAQQQVKSISYGARALMRALPVNTGRIESFTMTEPGSGYPTAPSIHIHDTQKTQDATIDVRMGNRVLGQPAFKNRGSLYTKFNAVTISSTGYADKYQTGDKIVIDGLTLLPSPGDNLRFSSITDVIYKVGNVKILSGTLPNATVEVGISPSLGVQESPIHAEAVTIRQNYSQVRLTFHDFLDIGTGGTTTTNYPLLYLEGFDSINPPEQMWEANEYNGGRVFYSSTDQDGNFRVGELFKVEQSTGIVTISASQFDLKGLDELRLGAFVLGGTNAVIKEFSKDGTFTANSNAIVPTQKAIATYLQSRISGGGSNVAANAVTAGTCKFSNLNRISNTGDLTINIPVNMHFTEPVGGTMVAQAFFNQGNGLGGFMGSQVDPEGDGIYYNDGGNGYDPGTGI